MGCVCVCIYVWMGINDRKTFEHHTHPPSHCICTDLIEEDTFDIYFKQSHRSSLGTHMHS